MANQCSTDFTVIGPKTVICQTLRLMIANLQANGVAAEQPPGDTAPIDERAAWVNRFTRWNFLEALSSNVISRPYSDYGTEMLVFPYGLLYRLRLDFDTRTIPARSELESFVDSLPSPCGVYALSEEPNMGIRDRLVVLKEDGVTKHVRLSSEYRYYEDSLDKTNREIDRFYAQMHKAITNRPAPLPMKFCENAACANDVEAMEKAWRREAPVGQIDLNRVFRRKAYDSFVWLLRNKSTRVSARGFDTVKALVTCCGEGNIGAADAILDVLTMDDGELKKAANAIGGLEDCDARTHVLERLESMCAGRGLTLPEVSTRRPTTATATAADPIAGAIGEHRTMGGMDWTVIARDGKRLLLSAADRLKDDAGEVVRRGYNDEKTSVTWETCSLRGWLNGEFLDRFSDEDRSMMVPARVINYDNEKVNTPGGNDTVDQVFCLSSAGLRALVEKRERASYDATWLRTPGNVPDMATCLVVGLYGAMVWQDGFDVDTKLMVMPAMWVEEPRSTVGEAGFFSAVGFEKLPSPAKKRLAIAYLSAPPESSFGDMELVGAYLRRNFKRIWRDVLASPNARAAVEGAHRLGYITADNLDDFTRAAPHGTANPEALEALAEIAAKLVPKVKKARKANPWSVSELKKLWKYGDAGEGLWVTDYRGHSSIALVPRTIGKKDVTSIHRWWRNAPVHLVVPGTVASVNWGNQWHPVVHAPAGSPAYLSAMMCGLTVVNLQYDPSEKGSYERAAEARAAEIEEMAGQPFAGEAFEAAPNKDSEVGGIVTLGRFPGTGVPVAWRVLGKRNGYALLLSEYIVASMALGRKGCDWAKTAARKWLNGEFLDDYLNDEERERVVPHGPDVLGGGLVDDDLIDGDRAFCLSSIEARRYLKRESVRLAYTTPYLHGSVQRIALDGSIQPCAWWLRSQGSPSFQFVLVGRDGRILTKGLPPKEQAGIRPAVLVRL